MRRTAYIIFFVAAALVSGVYAQDFKYDPHGKKDPFVPLVGVEKPSATDLESVNSIEEVRLEGIARSANGKPIAVINGQLLKENDRIGLIQIKEITKNKVTLLFDGKSYTLNIAEEGGPGGR